MNYPLEEGVEFKFVCVGCGSRHSTTIPRHGAPFIWRCKAPECGWVVTLQSDPAGVSVGHTAPIPKKPDLRLV